MEKRRTRELAPYKRNVSLKLGPPETELEPVRVLDDISVNGGNHEYLRKITHLLLWQFFLLSDCLKDLIERPGTILHLSKLVLPQSMTTATAAYERQSLAGVRPHYRNT
jgi:hypothetical protein